MNTSKVTPKIKKCLSTRSLSNRAMEDNCDESPPSKPHFLRLRILPHRTYAAPRIRPIPDPSHRTTTPTSSKHSHYVFLCSLFPTLLQLTCPNYSSARSSIHLVDSDPRSSRMHGVGRSPNTNISYESAVLNARTSVTSHDPAWSLETWTYWTCHPCAAILARSWL